jgi:Icc-related predicted phosphoesterase
MKICCISDTHSYHRQIKIPECDMLIHAGDITFKGELKVIEDFALWMKELPVKHKIVIHGNHEVGHERGPKREPGLKLLADAGLIYLQDSFVEIEGLKIYGSPDQPWFHNWEYNRQRGEEIAKKWAMIPVDTNILITHGPPYMIRDLAPRGLFDGENVGCVDLLNRISDLPNLKLHVFGHIHHSYGVTKIEQCSFVNASSCTESYTPSNAPIVVEI